jgi:hypothetical protein
VFNGVTKIIVFELERICGEAVVVCFKVYPAFAWRNCGQQETVRIVAIIVKI